MNASVKKVTEDAGGRFMFNTAISSIMELVNEMYRYKELPEINKGLLADAAESSCSYFRRLHLISVRKCGSISDTMNPCMRLNGFVR